VWPSAGAASYSELIVPDGPVRLLRRWEFGKVPTYQLLSPGSELRVLDTIFNLQVEGIKLESIVEAGRTFGSW
jgi:hypothetical protein